MTKICKFCGKEINNSSSCPNCRFIRNRVLDFEKMSPGAGPIEFEAYLKGPGGMRYAPRLETLSKIMNEVLRSGNGRPGIESSVRDEEYYGIV